MGDQKPDPLAVLCRCGHENRVHLAKSCLGGAPGKDCPCDYFMSARRHQSTLVALMFLMNTARGGRP